MAVRDIKLQSIDGDLLIENGDFVIFDSDYQHIHDIINDAPGEWKQFPTLGVNLKSVQYGPANVNQLQQTIKIQLTGDGYVCSPIVKYDYSISKLKINARATR